MRKITTFFILTILTLFTYSVKSNEPNRLKVSNLRTEMLVNPIGIDVVEPRLSWQLSSEERGIVQTSFHILVASSPDKLENNQGDIWDSGIVGSDQSHLVGYNGRELNSRDKCYWKVKVWSGNTESDWSEPAFWSMGLLYYKDWSGRWIGFDRPFPWDEDSFHARLSARYFRKEFGSDKEIKQATLSIIGLGLYELYINGEKIGDQVLAPTPTDYTKNVKYNTFDVTNNLQSGKNALGVVLGNGRYYTMRQHYKPYKIKNFGFPKMLLQLEIEYADGSSQRIKTDDSWKGTADGPIRSNNEYDGEEYDARKEMPGWNTVGFDDSNWLRAEYVQEPRGDFEAQMNENMKVMMELEPVSITEIKPDTFIMDMGQNMVGWIKMNVQGKTGDQVKLRFAEILNDEGELAMANLRDAKVTDIYTLNGSSEEVWEPSFIYHGFRYVEITGFPGKPKIENFQGRVVYDSIDTKGTFETSNKVTNQIYKNAYWGILGNYKGMPVDCPQRNERQPWLGDRAIGSRGESFVFDNGKLYAKWLDDIKYSQKADGAICDVAPAFWRYYSDNMTWPGTYLIIANMLYEQFGDKKPIEKHYPYMKKWLQYMRDRYMTNEYIVTKDSYGDWCVPPVSIEAGRGKSGDVKRPSSHISTAYYYYFMQMMQDFAKQTGNEEDIAGYAELGKKIKESFNTSFFDRENSFYGNNKLTDNLLPLYFGLIPEEHIDKVFDNIVHTIEVTNQGHLSTGLIGAQWLMRGLTNYGRADLAYKIATNTTYPSWGYMVENGATTIWELWNGNTAAPNMNSYNHTMLLGDLITWYYENLAGIKSDPENPGFKTIIMKPELPDGLDFINASYESPYGKIKSEWKKDASTFTWSINIPANTKAHVYIPVNSKMNVTESGKKVDHAEGMKLIRKEGKRALFELGSGEYRFLSEY